MALDFHFPVDTINEIESNEFHDYYLKKNIPVVIKGLLPQYEAFNKWTLDYFKNELGSIDVGVYNNKDLMMDRSARRAPNTMKFGDYLDLISENDKPVDARLFLFDIFKHKPQLKNDFFYPEIGVHFLKRFPFMFFGSKGSVVRMHQDADYSNVFLMQFHGRKRVILFHPKYSDLLYRFPFNFHTELDVTSPDYDKFPGLQFVRGSETILNHGDVLFMPSGYWHHIKYLDGGFAMSLRSFSNQWSNMKNGLVNVFFRTNFDELMRKLIGKSWFEYKQQMAIENANEAIKLIHQEGYIV